jgi:hypothetical protein
MTESNGQVQVFLRTEAAKRPLLHWGLRNNGEASWRLPPPSSWPEGSKTCAEAAVESPFTTQGGEHRLEIDLDKGADFSSIDFALFFPDQNRWDNNRGKNYQIAISASRQPSISPVDALQREIRGQGAVFQRAFDLAGFGQIAVAIQHADDRYDATLITNAQGKLLLHWGVAQKQTREDKFRKKNESTTALKRRSPF